MKVKKQRAPLFTRILGKLKDRDGFNYLLTPVELIGSVYIDFKKGKPFSGGTYHVQRAQLAQLRVQPEIEIPAQSTYNTKSFGRQLFSAAYNRDTGILTIGCRAFPLKESTRIAKWAKII